MVVSQAASKDRATIQNEIRPVVFEFNFIQFLNGPYNAKKNCINPMALWVMKPGPCLCNSPEILHRPGHLIHTPKCTSKASHGHPEDRAVQVARRVTGGGVRGQQGGCTGHVPVFPTLTPLSSINIFSKFSPLCSCKSRSSPFL